MAKKTKRRINKIMASEAFSMIITMIVSIFAIAFLIADVSKPVNAQTTSVTTCCEKTRTGEWCQNTLAENCDPAFQATPTSCDATSFCKTGCCYSSLTGECAKNSPKKLCEQNNGTWDPDSQCNIGQCSLGCCVLVNDAFLSTQVRCKKMSAAYGLNTDWRGSIQNELECIYQTQLKDTGACVYEEDFETTCKFTTREACTKISGGVFNKDLLCSAEELGTNCGPSDKTACVDGKDGVYYLDTCGNTANIYDASKRDNVDYWKNVVKPENSCNLGDSYANSASCGNCNYFTGSVCKSYKQSIDSAAPTLGNSVCRDLNCYDTSNGKDYKQGESWCIYDGSIGNGTDIVGSRHWRHLCIEGEEIVEPCSDYRQDICIQENIPIEGSSEKFSFAACRANDWRSCITYNQDTETAKANCAKNSDCYWFHVWTESAADPPNSVDVCLPQYPSGSKFGTEAGLGGEVSASLCSMAKQKVEVTEVKECKLFGLLGSKWVCKGGCETKGEAWTQRMNKWCSSLGDCGAKVNIAGVVTTDGYSVTSTSSKYGQKLSQVYLDNLKKLVVPVPGRVASGGGSGSGMGVVLGLLAGGLGIAAAFISNGAGGILSLSLVSSTPILAEGAAHATAEHGVLGAGQWYSPVIAVAGAYFAGTIIGQLFGLDSDTSKQLGIAGAVTAAGLMIGASQSTSFAAALGGSGTGWAAAQSVAFTAFVWAIVVIVAFAIIAKLFGCGKQKKYTVTFTCQSWQPPVGGNDCAKCNGDPLKPCSEYRCSSLGAGCKLLNSGTGKEVCAWVNKNDATAPLIKPWQDVLTRDFEYSNINPCPPGPGCFEIKPETSGKNCIPAYTPITFGITTNEPSQCNFDVNRSGKFEQMLNPFSNGLYLYNHSLTLTLPDPTAVQNNLNDVNSGLDVGDELTTFPLLSKDGNYNLYIMCRDGNGNANTVPLAMKFCVEKGPDVSPPVILDTSIRNGAGIGNGVNSTPLVVYVNEPSECKWGKKDYGGGKSAYDKYENSFTCDTAMSGSLDANYMCYTTLTGLKDNVDNNFYFLCKDQPLLGNTTGRNTMSQNYKFTLKGTIPLAISSIEPNGTISGGSEPITVNLKVETINGYDNGKANCFYSTVENSTGILFFSDVLEYSSTHEQSLNLASGNYNIFITCRDEAGNNAYGSTSFNIEVDNNPPVIIRAYREASTLTIATDEDSSCVYSIKNCNYEFDTGTAMTGEFVKEHSADWRTDVTYYIKCKDSFGNAPASASCSLVAHGYEIQAV